MSARLSVCRFGVIFFCAPRTMDATQLSVTFKDSQHAGDRRKQSQRGCLALYSLELNLVIGLGPLLAAGFKLHAL